MHSALGWIGKIADIYLIMIMALIIQAFVGGLFNWLARIPAYEDKPLNSYRQLLAIVNFGVAIILSISVIIEKSPLYLLSALGALTAVLLLVFRDSLLGLTASIQISTNDIVRNGDWITFEDYGADGNVTDINLTTIKVRNFDNTFTTVPTYAFISNSFKNWRGMQESGGRRIKRSILIDLMSIRFADEDLLGRLKEVDLLLPYIHERLEDIKTHNEKTVKNANATANGRRLTNIGLFRHYVQAYVEANPYINRNMVCMVRQLEPSAQGLPIEIYAFSREKDWPLYESIMADIFDHLFAVVTHFELRIFQQPSGTDFHNIGKA
jgi:miniconductance mechanosensitive channel